jgi:hypothetical protein
MSSHRHYHNPEREIVYFPSSAFGGATESKKLVGPKGKKGIVRDVLQTVTADLVGTTTVPEVTVGATAGATEYGRFRLGTAAGAGYLAANSPFRARNLVTGNPTPPVFNDFAGHVALETAEIPADTGYFITRKAGTGGAPAGTGESWVVIDWY